MGVSGIADPPGVTDPLAWLLRFEFEGGGPAAAIERITVPAPDKPGDADYLVLVTDDAARTEVLRLGLRPASAEVPARYEYAGPPVPLPEVPVLLAAPVDTTWSRLSTRRKLSRAVELSVVDAKTGEAMKVKLAPAKRPRGFDPERQANDPPDSVRARAPSLVGAGARLVLPAGVWILDADFVVPRGTTLAVEPGATLLIAPARSLFAYGRLELLGTAERPITLAPLGRGPWGVVALLGAGAKDSRFEHVRFVRGSSGAAAAQDLNGTLTVVDASATLTHCRFEQSRGEDTIHGERSTLTVSDSVFVGASSDGIDLVAATAEVTRCWFEIVGDDALDAGHGTKLTLRDSVVRGAAGKSVSAGQGSTVTVEQSFLLESERGVSVFDGSTISVSRTAIAYSKRAAIQAGGGDTGPGQATVTGSLFWENGSEWGHRDRIAVTGSREDVPFVLDAYRPLEGVGPAALPPRPADPPPFIAPEGGTRLITGSTLETPLSRRLSVGTWAILLGMVVVAGGVLLVLERQLRSRR